MYKALIKPFFSDAKNFVLDTLFPIRCIVCEREGNFVCEQCLPGLTRIEHQICIICKKPSILGMTHPGCKTPHGADGLVSVFNYHDERVAKTIIKGKYSFLPGAYNILGSAVAGKIESGEYKNIFASAWLCPIPLSKSRRRWRGFNQAEVLCKTLRERLGFPLLPALVRTKSTKTQKDLKREQRLENVKDCFALAKGADVHGKDIILVDDVTTTGSTLLEAAKVLKRNGARTVWCLTVARD